MKNNNLIELDLTKDEIQEFNDSITTLENLCQRFSQPLSGEDRQRLGSINGLNKLMIEKSKVLMKQNPHLIPAHLNTEEFERDYRNKAEIEEIESRLEKILRVIHDNKVLLEHDVYKNSLAFYRNVKFLANEQQEGAITVYDHLNSYFPAKKSKK
jgi:hypothetical protein